jgi:hypothetical protein
MSIVCTNEQHNGSEISEGSVYPLGFIHKNAYCDAALQA